LGDSAGNPRFIETVPRLGYRFIARIETAAESEGAIPKIAATPNGKNGHVAQASPRAELPLAQSAELPGIQLGSAQEPAAANRSSWLKRRRWSLAGAAGAAAVLAGSAVWYAHLPLPPPRITEVVQLTHDVRFHRKLVLGTNGELVYLSLEPPALGSVPISGGDITIIPFAVPGAKPVYADCLDAVSPDGLSFIACGAVTDGVWDIWVVGTSGSPVRFLTEAHDVGWSPDGKQVVYTNAHGNIYAMPSSGGESRLVLSVNGDPGNFPKCLIWSPEGKRIRFVRDARIWEVSSNGGNLHEVLPELDASITKGCGRWTPDGAFYIFLAEKSRRSGFQIWALDERHSGVRPPNPEPMQLTSGPNPWSLPTISSDGRILYAPNEVRQGELVRFDKSAGQFDRYLGGISAEWLDFSPDGKYVAYVSYPESTLWRANRDGSERIQLATLPPDANARGLHWSPDGSRIAFAESHAGVDAIYEVPFEGGTPTRVLPDAKESQSGPTWSPDGKRLAYWVNTTDETSMTEIRIADLDAHAVTHLPAAPKNAEWPLWSPNGRYILCRMDWLNAADFGFALFDMKTQKWSILHQPAPPSHPNWSHDSRFVYFLRTQDAQPGVYRMSVPDGQTNLAIDLKDFRTTGSMRRAWLGLDPSDVPLLLRDAGSFEIYALTLDRK
jgi:Tol biopolymer transport system component